MGVRLVFKDSPLSVNYGYAGAVPPEYITRLLTPASWPDLVSLIFLAFGPLWIGLWGLRKMPAETRLIGGLYMGLVIIAALLLSSRITRVIQIAYIVVIPGFLMLMDEKRKAPLAE
jgi:hypothetical protein